MPTLHITIPGAKQGERLVILQNPSTPNWQARAWFPELTKPKNKSTGTQDEHAAREIAKAMFYEWRGMLAGGGTIHKVMFESASDSWLQEYKERLNADPHNKGTMLNEYERMISTYFNVYFQGHAVDEVRDRDITRYRAWRLTYWTEGPGKNITHQQIKQTVEVAGKQVTRTTTRRVSDRVRWPPADSTIRLELSCLRSIFQHAQRNGWLGQRSLPDFGVQRHVAKPRPAFEEDHIKTLIDYLREQMLGTTNEKFWHQRRCLWMFTEIVLGTGIRPGTETGSLRWKDIHIREKDGAREYYLYPVNAKPKPGQPDRRTVVVAPALANKLLFWRLSSRWAAPEHPILSQWDKPEPVRQFNKGFRAALKKLGIQTNRVGQPYEPYSLRHTFATFMLERGVDPWVVCRNLGHQSLEMLKQHYGQDTVQAHYKTLAYAGLEQLAERQAAQTTSVE